MVSYFRNCENVKVSTWKKGPRDCKFRRSDTALLGEFVIEDRGARRLRRSAWRWRGQRHECGNDKRADPSGEHISPPSCSSFLPRLKQLDTGKLSLAKKIQSYKFDPGDDRDNGYKQILEEKKGCPVVFNPPFFPFPTPG